MSRLFANDPDDYLVIGDHADFAASTAITVDAWVWWDVAETDQPKYIISKYPLWLLRISLKSGYEGFVFTIVDSSTGYDAIGGTPQADRWYHMAGTYDGTTVKVRVYDHTAKTVTNYTTSHTGSIDTGAAPIYVGTYEGKTDSFDLQGKVANVRVWKDVALSDGEIDQVRWQTVPTAQVSSLVGNWPLINGYSPEKDYSGKNHNATVNQTSVGPNPPLARIFGLHRRGWQGAFIGGPTQVTLTANMPAPSATITPLKTLARTLTATQPAPSATISPRKVSLATLTAAQPAPSADISQVYQIALAADMPAAAAMVTALQTLARSLSANMPPASAGLSLIEYLIALAADQPAASATVSAQAVTGATLTAEQPAPSATVAVQYAIALTAEMPASSAIINALQTLARTLMANQPAASATIANLVSVALAANMPAATAEVTALAISILSIAITLDGKAAGSVTIDGKAAGSVSIDALL